MMQKSPIVKPLSPLFYVFDYFLTPIMFILGGLNMDSIQETHYWHCSNIDPRMINNNLGMLVHGNDPSTKTNKLLPLPLFHMPILGGWKNYFIMKAAAEVKYWHVGWSHLEYPVGFRASTKVHRLRIYDKYIKLLNMPIGHETLFFGFDNNGKQIPVKIIDEGILGDHKYPKVRLF